MLEQAHKQLHQSFHDELHSILTWWKSHMVDLTGDGFHGRIDGNNVLHPTAHRAVILNTRILWAFSAAAKVTRDQGDAEMAHRAYLYIVEHFVDHESGGVYWSVNHRGKPVETKKQVYAQAFAIYAMSAYFQLTGNTDALDLALHIFSLLEQHSHDPVHGGYFEAFDRHWAPLNDMRLSDKDLNAAKTMNTHLHMLEAYTNLYRIKPLKGVSQALVRLIQCFLERFFQSTGHQWLFFDADWRPLSESVSFGHDIECSWLLMEAAGVLVDDGLTKEVRSVAMHMAKATLEEGTDPRDGALFNERRADGTLDRDKHWWPQAEAVVGFWNAWESSGEEKYPKAALRVWDFIREKLIDPAGGEWFWGVDSTGKPMPREDQAGPWKAPYHNTRMCLEMMRRMG